MEIPRPDGFLEEQQGTQDVTRPDPFWAGRVGPRGRMYDKMLHNSMIAGRRGVLAAFATAVLAIAIGTFVAMARYPGGFDWSYTVISRLASPRHNPDGGAWLCGGLLAGTLLLWPVTTHIGRLGTATRPTVALGALRLGLIGGVLLALEGLFTVDLGSFARKGHEALALVTFLGLYAGVLGIYFDRIRRGGSVRPALLVLVPLIAVGTSQLVLYFDQRDLGWVNTSWRDLGVPVWLSFAFWQWLAVLVLAVGLAHLAVTTDAHPRRPIPRSGRRHVPSQTD